MGMGQEIMPDKARTQNFFESTAESIDHTSKQLIDFRARLDRIIDAMVGPQPKDERDQDKGPTEVPSAGTRMVQMALEGCNVRTADLEGTLCRLESCGLT